MDGGREKKRKPKNPSDNVSKKRRLHGVDELKEMTDRDNDTSLEREEKEPPTMAHTDKEDPSKGSDQEDSDGETTYEMNRPTLLRQLQTILGEYPDDEQMLREMVQNAEDAGANCMKIMYDSRTRDPGGNSTIKQYFKTPGIFVYNDAMFSDDDWKGIISIYNSVKEKEPLKVGRFGLGFKSVFHMTDSPVIISGSKLLVIDPLRSVEKEEECREFKLKTVGRKHQPETTLACLMNKFGFDTDVLREGTYEGTIFWFPLRQKQSKLSPTIYSEEKAANLFKSFMKKSTYNLVFLKNLEKIEIYKEQNDQPYFTLEITGTNEEEFCKARKMFKDDLNNLKKELPRKSIMSKYEAVIKTNTTEEHYAVVNMLTGADYLSKQMNYLVSDSSLHYSPYTGVAYCMTSSMGGKPPGHVFCFLPLPVTEKSMSGLPVHVNGFFDLEHNRRHIKEAPANSESKQTDQSLMWNDGMIGELLPDTYYTLIEMMKTRCIKGNNSQDMVDQVYDAIPNPDAVESSWKLILDKLYENILSGHVFFTKQDGGRWIEFSDALFAIFNLVTNDNTNDNQMTETTVKKLLLDCDENLVEVPDHMITMLKYTGHEPQSVTPLIVREKLKSFECWKTYPREEKLRLLSFVLEDCNYADLRSLEILPLNNQEFVPFSTGTDVYVICDETAILFPGLEDQVVSKSSVTEFIWNCLSKMAENGLFQLRCLTDESLPGVMQKVFDINFTRNQNGRFVQASQSNFGIDWIQKVWKEISNRNYDNLSSFESIPLIVVGPGDVEDINNIATDENLVLEYVSLKGRYMLSKFDNHEPLSAALEKVITLTEVEVFHPNQMIKFPHTDVIGKYIQLPIIDNVLNCFKMDALSIRRQQIARQINELCSDNERRELVQFLTNHCSDIPIEAYQLLQKLDLFCEHDNVSVSQMVSLEENKFILKDFMYPEGMRYPRKYLENEHAELAKLLGTTDVEEIKCVDQTLDLMLENSIKYYVEDYTQLMIYLQDRPPKVLNTVLEKAKSLKFMPSTDGTLHSVNNLFDPTSGFLKNLLYGEEGVFPNENFIQENGINQSFLQNLGLKTEDNISSDDVVQVATSIHMFANGMEEKKNIKAESLISYLKKHEDISSNKALQKIKGLKWVPIEHEKPDDYPYGLGWHGSKTFCSPYEVKSMQFKNLIGTVCPLVRVDLFSKQVTACYKWCEEPEPNNVIEHYRNVINSYERRQNSEYLHITKHIIGYLFKLWEAGSLNDDTIKKLNAIDCIPTNSQGFKSAQIVVQEIGNKHINYSLEPYIFELARDVADFSKLFLELGMKGDVGFHVLKSLLQRISEKYMSKEETPADNNELEKDRILTYNILKSIVAMEINKSELSEILIPINSSREECIVFEKVEKCTYTSGKSPFSTAFCQDDDDDDDDDCEENEEKIIYVHPSVNELASKLGVASITKRFIYNQNTEVLAWGQEEKLTTRISGLLDSYTDGFAVPKELVQNADDAGATKVCFLYDERENLELRNGLFDQGMAECQGPALWVYNDAIFEEKDFKNIIELGGKTKILDTEKIGKFGLGFCSVYNVTDVPSFVSKNTLVILDPHLHHLGEAAIGTNPGLRLPLTKSYRKNFPNQFKPYNDIFGCNLEPNNKDDYNNTLFRLPLRTQKQAQESEITDKQYTKREVVQLMQIFLHSAANLLLFTQNVKEISVYHLNSESQNPKEDMKLMFQAWKENTEKSVEKNEFNILKKVTSAMKGEQTSEIKFSVQIIDIGIEVSSEAHAISKEFHTSRAITSWIISWGTGNKTFELANKLKQQGAIPVGSVAVPIRRDGNKLISFMDMDELPKGFYSKSRMFCFLPLPVEAQLPVHLNGCFMVEQDRKSITRYNQDDKTNDTSYWNDAMLDDVIQSAYINLLASVACRSNDPIVETDYWKVWPRMTSMTNLDIHLLTQSFYRSIIMKDDIVFYRRSTGMGSGVQCSLSQALVLEPAFRHSGENGQIAFDCLLEFYQDSCIIIDMPLDIYKNFSETPGVDINKLTSRIISKVDFYDQYFFPNLKEDYWQQLERRKERDRLIIGALDDEDLHYLVKKYECIPVQMSEELRMPCDLVLETGRVSAMFTVEDERFYDTSFNCYNSILINMGMMEDKISSTLLKERARTVGSLCKEIAFARSTAILKYLNEKICLHSDATEDLKNIPFLPVLQKIDGWPLPWKADDLEPEEYLFPPSQLFSPNDKFVIGSVGYVLDAEHHEQAVLECIGIKTVHIENVVEQINVLANGNLHSSVGLEKTCDELYKRLNYQLLVDSSNLIVIKTIKDFQHKRIVRVESNMVEPIRVAFTVAAPCFPFLYEMPRDFKIQYSRLWNIVGIPVHFDENTLTGKLQEQAKLKGLEQITPEETQSIINILKNLSEYYPAPPTGMPEEKKNVMFIPDQNRILRPMCDVCYDDPDFHYEDEDVFIVHGDVTQKIIRHLGIMSKRHLYLSRYSDSIPFGQKEKLVTRLKGIIDAYPKDQSVLNELLQNADDAKATEIHFVYDQRQLGTKDVFDKKWEPVQGPALCVFNNSCFTAKDLQGIQNLGEGSKSEDPSKTGQFGVGFNAVYHLTDVPSFLTRGQDTPDGGTFCVFDPHCSYLNVAQPESPGMRLKLDRFQSKYGDVYKGYLQDVVKANTGTWFRLPLRTLEMARKSEISSKSFSERDMNTLLEKMKLQMKTSLLFLSNIKKISISYIKENCTELSDTFSVCLSVSDLDIENVREFSSTVLTESKMIKSKEKTLNQISLKEVRYTATVEDNENNSDIWLIVKTFGFNKGKAVADCVLTAFSKGELGFLPRGGTAMKVCTKIMNIQEELPKIYIQKCCDGNAFCFLPLPIKTGLPVHINGHFSVYANRNGLFGGNSDTLSDDNRTKWNNLLLQQNIAFAYASCLEYAKKMLPYLLNTLNHCDILCRFFAGFPEYSKVTDSYWKELVNAVYGNIYKRSLDIFPIYPKYTNYKQEMSLDNLPGEFEQEEIDWIPLESEGHTFKACFDNLKSFYQLEEEDDTDIKKQAIQKQEIVVRRILVQSGMKLICTPLWILKSICSAYPVENLSNSNSSSDLESSVDFNCTVADVLTSEHIRETSETVASFFKSWNTRILDKCSISNVNIPLKDSIFQTIEGLSYFLQFCLKLKIECKDLEGLPLMANNSEDLVCFMPSTTIMSEFCNLLPSSSAKFVHDSLVRLLLDFKKHFKSLDVGKFSAELLHSADEQFYQKHGPLPWDSRQSSFPNGAWMEMFWKFLKTVPSISELSNWCLFPVCWYQKEEVLISFNLAYTVVNYNSFDQQLVDDKNIVSVLKKLSIPSLSSYNKRSKHVGEIVASKQQPEKLARCLVFHKKAFTNATLNQEECNKLVTYLATNVSNIRSYIRENIKQLKIFTSIFGEIVSVEGLRVLVVDTDNSNIVLNGLAEQANRTNTLLLKHNAFHVDLYTALQFKICQIRPDEHKLLEFYRIFVLPNFELIPRNLHLPHLEFIRDKLITGTTKYLQSELRDLKFIPSLNGDTLQKACDYFSPHHTVFSVLCKPSELPPCPFENRKWKYFMEFAGMKLDLTNAQFLEFAQYIQNQGLAEFSESQSAELIRYLFSQERLALDQHFLRQIREIQFIKPFEVPRNYSDISPQFSANKLVAFSGSLTHKHSRLAWTIQNILPAYASTSNPLLLEGLLIQREPEINTIVSHVHNVCHSLQKGYPSNKKDFVVILMTEIYDYIEALPMQTIEGMKSQLSETPFIHIVDHKTFIKVRNVILKGETYSEIPPYLLIASENYGKYFTLFRTLGAKNYADLNNYIRVLASIKEEVGSKTLKPEELECTESAVRGVLSVLQGLSDTPTVEEPVFYLLSSKEKLIPSKELVYPDRPWKYRLKNQNDIKFLKSMDQFKDEGFDVYHCFSILPDTMQPKKLSTIVKEELLTDRNRIPWEVARTLEAFLASEIFMYAIKRLVKTKKNKQRVKKIEDSTLEKISSNIRSVRIVALQEVQTVLVYRNQQITTSAESITFYHKREENIIYVKKTNLDMSQWLIKKLHQVAAVIVRLCMYEVDADKLQNVLLQYGNDFEEMEKTLNELKAVPLDFKPGNTSWVPPPGTPVPLDCLDSLVQDLVKFLPGDYAVYQIFDNIDEDEDGQNKARIYIYVKIIKQVTEGQFPLYKVDVGEEQTKDVHSFLLFQIDRKKNQEMGLELHTHGHAGYNMGNTDKIKQQIEETLVDAWRLGLDKFKKIYKRLLLQWHPDKNYNSAFCCEITKHIIDFTNRLMYGEIDVSSIPQYRERRGNSCGGNWQAYNDGWNEHVHRARRKPHDSREECYTFDANGYADRVRHRHRGRRRNHTHYSHTEYHPDPQPQNGRIWLKQAKNDISAARSFLTTATEQSYNWVCVISQQAAEKALKAIQVCEDFKQVSNYHSLITSGCLKNPTLKQAADELERCIGDYSKMRYPRPVFYPNTPSDLYSQEDAIETIKWAEIIVSTVDDMM